MPRDTRAALVQAAAARLRVGEADFTYERLAADAGVARQTLYSRFPDRADLIVAAVEELRAEVPELDALQTAVLAAPTGRAALTALLDLHVAFTPQLLRALRSVEAQRASSPRLSAAFERRSQGRRQLVRHVVSRLHAEGDLAPEWQVDEAADVVSALLAGSVTAELLQERKWTPRQLRQVLDRTLTRALLQGPVRTDPNRPGGPS